MFFLVVYKKSRHSGRDCRNPDYMDVFKIAIHDTGYPRPGGYDELPVYLYLMMRGHQEVIISQPKHLDKMTPDAAITA